MLGRFSSKVGSLLDELADVLGAFDGIPVAQEGQHLIPLLHRKHVASCCCMYFVLLRLSDQLSPSMTAAYS